MSSTAVATAVDAPQPRTGGARLTLARIPVEPAVFAVALLARLSVIFRAGGLHGNYGYDGPVYFAAADAFVHGRLPYRDFVLVHPPGLMLALSPFAALTRVVSDETAFTIANLAFTVLAALNAVLVVRVCRALGLSRPAAAAGGLFYATSFAAIGAEYLTKLEPLGNALFLAAMLFALRGRGYEPNRGPNRGRDRAGRGRPAGWPSWAAGVALGLTVTVKIWWIVPAAAVLIWYAVTTRRARPVLAMTGGAFLAGLAVCLPFFLAAPRAMVSFVITDQVGRQPSTTHRVSRITDLTSVPRLSGQFPIVAVAAGTVLALAVMAVAIYGAWQLHRSRPVVVLLALQAAVLLLAPSFFYHYADYPSAAAAVTVAAAAAWFGRQRARTHLPGRRRTLATLAWAPVAVAAAVSALIVGTAAAVVHPLVGAASLARSVAGVRCVMSDTPMTLLELNVLSRDLADGCRNWVDVTGRTYGVDRPTGASTLRTANLTWQRDLTAYLRSGQAVIIGRRSGTGVSHSTQHQISRDGVLARAGGQVVYRVEH